MRAAIAGVLAGLALAAAAASSAYAGGAKPQQARPDTVICDVCVNMAPAGVR